MTPAFTWGVQFIFAADGLRTATANKAVCRLYTGITSVLCCPSSYTFSPARSFASSHSIRLPHQVRIAFGIIIIITITTRRRRSRNKRRWRREQQDPSTWWLCLQSSLLLCPGDWVDIKKKNFFFFPFPKVSIGVSSTATARRSSQLCRCHLSNDEVVDCSSPAGFVDVFPAHK